MLPASWNVDILAIACLYCKHLRSMFWQCAENKHPRGPSLQGQSVRPSTCPIRILEGHSGPGAANERIQKVDFEQPRHKRGSPLTRRPCTACPIKSVVVRNLPKPVVFWSQRWQDYAEIMLLGLRIVQNQMCYFPLAKQCVSIANQQMISKDLVLTPTPKPHLTSLQLDTLRRRRGREQNWPPTAPKHPNGKSPRLKSTSSGLPINMITWWSGKDFTTFGSKCWQETIKPFFGLGCFSEKACDAEQRSWSVQGALGGLETQVYMIKAHDPRVWLS